MIQQNCCPDRVGNAINVTASNIRVTEWHIFEPYYREVTNRIRYATWTLTAKEGKTVLKEKCTNKDRMSPSVSMECLNIRILYNIGAYKHPGLARGVTNRLMKLFNPGDNVDYVPLSVIVLYEYIYDKLKAEVLKFKVSCPQCFDWEENEEIATSMRGALALTMNEMYINTTGNPRKEKQDRESLLNALELSRRLEHLNNIYLTLLGNLMTSYLSTEPDWTGN